tara:strand:- start:208 stop:420 length:213 start_codon:yes stop_codon:yes gene_type:complete
MNISKGLILSLVAPLMILISIFGLIIRGKNKIFYVPIGVMGITIILEKDFRRKLDRKNILKKIKSFQKVK